MTGRRGAVADAALAVVFVLACAGAGVLLAFSGLIGW